MSNHKLISCTVYCDQCKKEHTIKFNEYNLFDGLCFIETSRFDEPITILSFQCPECKKEMEIEV